MAPTCRYEGCDRVRRMVLPRVGPGLGARLALPHSKVAATAVSSPLSRAAALIRQGRPDGTLR